MALKNLKSYFNKWNIINPENTKAIYFTRKRKSWFLPQSPLRFMDHDISWEDSVKYLGIILDPNKLSYIMYPLINRKSFLNIDNKKLKKIYSHLNAGGL